MLVSAFTLLLAFYSQLNSGGRTWDKFDPILVLAFVLAFVCIFTTSYPQIGGRYEQQLGRFSFFPRTPLATPSVLLNAIPFSSDY